MYTDSLYDESVRFILHWEKTVRVKNQSREAQVRLSEAHQKMAAQWLNHYIAPRHFQFLHADQVVDKYFLISSILNADIVRIISKLFHRLLSIEECASCHITCVGSWPMMEKCHCRMAVICFDCIDKTNRRLAHCWHCGVRLNWCENCPSVINCLTCSNVLTSYKYYNALYDPETLAYLGKRSNGGNLID